MNKIFYFILFFICCHSNANAQVTFQKIYNVTANFQDGTSAFQQTADSGFIIAGQATVTSFDIFLLKTNSDGDILWSIVYDGSSSDNVYTMQQTNDGGFILGGESFSFFSGESFLLKTDSVGNILWLKVLSNTGGLTWIEQTHDGGYITSGVSNNFPWEVLITKCNTTGDVVWSKNFSSFDLDECDMIHETSDGGFIMVAEQNLRNFLIKLDSTGTVMWSKQLSRTTAVDPILRQRSVYETSDHGFIILTDVWTSPSTTDIVVIKTDSLGSATWSMRYNSGYTIYSGSVKQDQNGEYLITSMRADSATSPMDLIIIKTDPSGLVLWSKLYGGSSFEGIGEPSHLLSCFTNDGGIATITGTSSFGPNTDFHSYFIKSDSLGNSGCNEIATLPLASPIQIIDSLYPLNSIPFITAASSETMLTTMGFNSQSILCFYDQVMELEEKKIFQIYPNPAIGNIKIKSNGVIIESMEVNNALGKRMVMNKSVMSKEIVIESASFPSGIYFVKLQVGSEIYMQKFIKH